MYYFAREIYFVEKSLGNNSTRNESLIRLLKSPATLISGISTISLPENSNELCDRLKLLLHEKQAGNNSNKIDEEIVAIADKLLEYKCNSTKQTHFFTT